jgi:hypothetical protein
MMIETAATFESLHPAAGEIPVDVPRGTAGDVALDDHSALRTTTVRMAA